MQGAALFNAGWVNPRTAVRGRSEASIPTKAIPGGPVYDVVNNRGELIDRVQVPADRSIVGFGSSGLVYLTVRENNTTFLERARVR